MFGQMDPQFGSSQFAGGGYMRDDEPTSAPRKEYGQSPDSMRSVTIKQLRNAVYDEHDCAIIDGEPLKNVTIVGKVLTKELSAANLELRIYDGTGDVIVKSFSIHNNQVVTAQVEALQPGKYCRVYGLYKRVQEGQLESSHISAFNVRPVTDHNEVVYHNLTVIFEHQFLTRGKLAVGHGAPPAAVAAPVAMGHANTKQAVINFYRSLKLEPGAANARASDEEIFQGVGPGHSRQAVEAALKELLDGGSLYHDGAGFVLI